jgi:hypothetical protein
LREGKTVLHDDDLRLVLDRIIEADKAYQESQQACTKCGYRTDKKNFPEGTKLCARCYAPRCGHCVHWMKSRECPRETNVKGWNRGPSCDALPCDKFERDMIWHV